MPVLTDTREGVVCNPFAPLTQSGSADGATEWVTSPFVSDHDSQQSEVRGSLRVFVWVALQAVVVYAFSWAASSSATDTGLYVAAAPATVSLPRLAQAVPHRPSTSTRHPQPLLSRASTALTSRPSGDLRHLMRQRAYQNWQPDEQNKRKPLSPMGWVVRFLAGISLYSFVFGHPEAPTVATVAAEGSLEMELEPPDNKLAAEIQEHLEALLPEPEDTHEGAAAAVEEVPDIGSDVDLRILTQAQEFRINSMAGFVATMVSAALTFPIDTLKTRLQAGKPGIPEKKGLRGLYKGIIPSMIVFCPTVSVFVGLSYWFKSMFMGFAVVASSAKLQLLATMVAGAMSNLLLSVYRVPTSMMVKLIQTGVCENVQAALKRIFMSEGCWRTLGTIWIVVLFKDIPNGALRMGIYHFYEECLSFLMNLGMSAVTQRTVSGIIAGMTLGLLANPIDLVVTRAMTQIHDMKGSGEYSYHSVDANGVIVMDRAPTPGAVQVVRQICGDIWSKDGVWGFFAGAWVRALSRIPSTCVWFAVFDIMKSALLNRHTTAFA